MDGGKVFGTKIVKTVPLEEFKQAVDEYESVATQGKILIKC